MKDFNCNRTLTTSRIPSNCKSCRVVCYMVLKKYAVAQRPLLLLIDGHSSHLTLELLNVLTFAKTMGSYCFCMPPHNHAHTSTIGRVGFFNR